LDNSFFDFVWLLLFLIVPFKFDNIAIVNIDVELNIKHPFAVGSKQQFPYLLAVFPVYPGIFKERGVNAMCGKVLIGDFNSTLS